MFANIKLTPEQQAWKESAKEDGRVKTMSPGFKCVCGEAQGTFAKSAAMTTGEGIGAVAFRLCKDCKCYACGAETAELKTR
ncbi:MAG: hypothetical protein FWD48_10475 [Oscillospiraceae bacterium]|nr:hypothetical protein [Oscillospiraceae bacterium]